MKRPRIGLRARWVMVAVAAIERRERLQRGLAVERAQTAYRDATLARELAETEVKQYAEGTFRRELATVEAEIRQAEDRLNAVSSEVDWAERIRAKGSLLLIRGPSKELVVKRATFAVEQAKSEKLVLEEYAKAKRVKELNDRVAMASTDELAKQAAYDAIRAKPTGFFGRVFRRTFTCALPIRRASQGHCANMSEFVVTRFGQLGLDRDDAERVRQHIPTCCP